VIAHELGHLKCEHGVWITLANLLPALATLLPVRDPRHPARLLRDARGQGHCTTPPHPAPFPSARDRALDRDHAALIERRFSITLHSCNR
jgi:hypothetical protein